MYLKRSDCVPGKVLRGSGVSYPILLYTKTSTCVLSTDGRKFVGSLEPVLLLDAEFEETRWYLKVLMGKGEVGWIWFNPETPGFTLT